LDSQEDSTHSVAVELNPPTHSDFGLAAFDPEGDLGQVVDGYTDPGYFAYPLAQSVAASMDVFAVDTVGIVVAVTDSQMLVEAPVGASVEGCSG